MRLLLIKFGYSEKATKFEKIFHLKFDVTEFRQILSGRFFQTFCPSQNILTLRVRRILEWTTRSWQLSCGMWLLLWRVGKTAHCGQSFFSRVLIFYFNKIFSIIQIMILVKMGETITCTFAILMQWLEIVQLYKNKKKSLLHLKCFAFLEQHKLMLQFDVILKKNGVSLNNWHFLKKASNII